MPSLRPGWQMHTFSLRDIDDHLLDSLRADTSLGPAEINPFFEGAG